MVYTLVNNGDVPDEDYFNLSLMNQTVIVCTSGTRPGSPVEGMTVYETDTNQLKVYNGTAWRRSGAFDQETAGATAVNESTTISSITSSTFAAGSPVCGVAFKAPPSGGVYVTVSGRIGQSSNGNEIQLGWELRTGASIGSGTITVATSSLRTIAAGKAVNGSAPITLTASRRYMVATGTLTAGDDFNVRTMHRIDAAGTGTVEYRELIIEPVL